MQAGRTCGSWRRLPLPWRRLRFSLRQASLMREGQKVVVYRHDGTENGTWTRVSRRIEISSTENTVTTDKFDPSSATWNAGWFAVVAQNYGGTTILFR